MAHDTADFQPHRTTAGEIQDQGRDIRADAFGSQRQQGEDPVGLARMKAAAADRRHLVYAKTRQDALTALRFRLTLARARLPAETIGDQDEAMLFRDVSHL